MEQFASVLTKGAQTTFEEQRERAILVGVDRPNQKWSLDSSLAELERLAAEVAEDEDECCCGHDHHDHEHCHHDHFKDISPDTDWNSQTEHAEKIGLGSRKYELIRL